MSPGGLGGGYTEAHMCDHTRAITSYLCILLIKNYLERPRAARGTRRCVGRSSFPLGRQQNQLGPQGLECDCLPLPGWLPQTRYPSSPGNGDKDSIAYSRAVMCGGSHGKYTRGPAPHAGLAFLGPRPNPSLNALRCPTPCAMEVSSLAGPLTR